MNVDDILYFAPPIKCFAPPIKFAEVDIDGCGLPEQFKQRMDGFYIVPSEECADRGQAFASGVMAVTSIDAMARLRFGDLGQVGKRFRKFSTAELKSFWDPDIAERFYEEFQNGLVHESRLKNGAQFSLEICETVLRLDNRLVVNPIFLAAEVRLALDAYVALLKRNEEERKNLSCRLKRDLKEDFKAVR